MTRQIACHKRDCLNRSPGASAPAGTASGRPIPACFGAHKLHLFLDAASKVESARHLSRHGARHGLALTEINQAICVGSALSRAAMPTGFVGQALDHARAVGQNANHWQSKASYRPPLPLGKSGPKRVRSSTLPLMASPQVPRLPCWCRARGGRGVP